MSNESIIIPHDAAKHYLKLVRKKRFVECLSYVYVFINGVEAGRLDNGDELILEIPAPEQEFTLELQSPAWRNFYSIFPHGDVLVEFGFPFLQRGLASYNNTEIFFSRGCTIVEKDKLATQRQKLDWKISGIAIGICLVALIVLQLSQCHLRIVW